MAIDLYCRIPATGVQPNHYYPPHFPWLKGVVISEYWSTLEVGDNVWAWNAYDLRIVAALNMGHAVQLTFNPAEYPAWYAGQLWTRDDGIVLPWPLTDYHQERTVRRCVNVLQRHAGNINAFHVNGLYNAKTGDWGMPGSAADRASMLATGWDLSLFATRMTALLTACRTAAPLTKLGMFIAGTLGMNGQATPAHTHTVFTGWVNNPMVVFGRSIFDPTGVTQHIHDVLDPYLPYVRAGHRPGGYTADELRSTVAIAEAYGCESIIMEPGQIKTLVNDGGLSHLCY